MSIDRNAKTRDAGLDDAEEIAALADRLGYPCDAGVVRARLGRYLDNHDERVVVVEAEGKVAGWASVGIVDHLFLEPYVEISGFVIEESLRGHGLGRVLMAEVERWAREKGLPLIRLRANAIRKGAHAFYGRMGFEKKKEQYTFEKRVLS